MVSLTPIVERDYYSLIKKLEKSRDELTEDVKDDEAQYYSDKVDNEFAEFTPKDHQAAEHAELFIDDRTDRIQKNKDAIEFIEKKLAVAREMAAEKIALIEKKERIARSKRINKLLKRIKDTAEYIDQTIFELELVPQLNLIRNDLEELREVTMHNDIWGQINDAMITFKSCLRHRLRSMPGFVSPFITSEKAEELAAWARYFPSPDAAEAAAFVPGSMPESQRDAKTTTKSNS